MTLIDAPPPPPPAPSSATATVPVGLGEVLAGKYRIDRLLGAGGMGIVLGATHTELDQRVAIKMMREEALGDADARARFAREARAVVRLKSEHVARVLDVGTHHNGAPFLVLEFLEGCDLATTLEDRGRLAVDESVAYLLQVCEAVAEAHGAGIIHRDLKPRNIFVTTGADGRPLLKVLDFGISKLVPPLGAREDPSLTKTTDVMGSPSYMAPEQMKAARDADERADIWSLGVILFELVTGRLPWEAESISELAAMVLRDPPRSMRELRPEIPVALERIVLTCLEKQRQKRYASVSSLAHELEPHALALAVGSAGRITDVARTSRMPPANRPRLPSSSSSSRVIVSGGTSVSWGETEPMPPPKVSVAPQLPSRSGLLVAAGCLVVAGLAGGGYALSRAAGETTRAPSAAPVLPEDRGAIRPPPTSATAATTPEAFAPAPPTTGITTPGEPRPPAERAAVPAPSKPIDAVPRRAPPPASPLAAGTAPPALQPLSSAPGRAENAATNGPAKTAPAKAPAAADPHDFGAIPRK